jgi:hypothetical protein
MLLNIHRANARHYFDITHCDHVDRLGDLAIVLKESELLQQVDDVGTEDDACTQGQTAQGQCPHAQCPHAPAGRRASARPARRQHQQYLERRRRRMDGSGVDMAEVIKKKCWKWMMDVGVCG